MPRTGGTYYLPSPPMPLVPGTLAAAEDMNTIFSDIATALTNSVPTDGSAAITGNLNLNGYSITGATNISAGNVNASGTVTAPVFNATTGMYVTALLGSVNGNGQSLTGLNDLTTASATVSGNLVVSGTISPGAIAGYYTADTSDARYLYKSGDTCTGDLTVNGTLSAASTMSLYSSGGGQYLQFSPGYAWVLRDSDGTVFLITNNGVRLQQAIDGTFQVFGAAGKPGGGTWFDNSDARIKTVLGDFTDGLAEICRLRPRRYQFNQGEDTKTEHVGFVAQEIEAVMPQTVSYTRGKIGDVEVDDLRRVDATRVIYALVNAVQQLAARQPTAH